MTPRQFLMLMCVVFVGGFLGGVVSDQLLSGRIVQAQKSNGVSAEEYLLIDPTGKARAGLGLDAQGEIGLVLTNKDGSRTLTLSPDDRLVIKLVERDGRVLWAVP